MPSRRNEIEEIINIVTRESTRKSVNMIVICDTTIKIRKKVDHYDTEKFA